MNNTVKEIIVIATIVVTLVVLAVIGDNHMQEQRAAICNCTLDLSDLSLVEKLKKDLKKNGSSLEVFLKNCQK